MAIYELEKLQALLEIGSAKLAQTHSITK